MSHRKIRKSALCVTMSLVLALCGCSAAAPAADQADTDQASTSQKAADQADTDQASTSQKAADQASTDQEMTVGETPAQETVQEDVFDFEEGDQNAPSADGEMPSKYDLRDVQVKGSGIVPPIRFQNPFGTCWSFGAIAAAEMSILGSGLAQDDGYTAETFDLSEKHLAYFAYSALDDPEDPQNGEGMKWSAPAPGSEKMQGGETSYATWLFASGIGPNLEDWMPAMKKYWSIREETVRQRAASSPGTMKTEKSTAAGDGFATARTMTGPFRKNTASISPID